MAHTNVGQRSLEQQLSDLGVQFLVTEVGKTDGCLREEALRELAAQTKGSLSATAQHHINSCARCAHLHACMRAADRIRALPAQWEVSVRAAEFHPADDLQWQLLGYVDVEARRFEPCEAYSGWVHHPRNLRVNLVVDKIIDFFSLTILDVPSSTAVVALETPSGQAALARSADDPLFEVVQSLSGVVGVADPDAAGDTLLQWLAEGKLRLRLQQCGAATDPYGPETLAAVLEAAGAVERAWDYELPNGRYSDTGVNVGKLCASEEVLCRVAAAFHRLFRDVRFDTILTNGWAMATIARRLASLRTDGPLSDAIADVICEGYDQLTLTEDILPASRVLILVDVNVTGTLLSRLQDVVQRAGAQVVGMGALVAVRSLISQPSAAIRHLCVLDMDIRDRPRSGVRRKVFNPVLQSYTERAPFPRSPAQFLDDHPEAKKFWEAIMQVKEAYKPHKKEGDTHYIGFIDTKKLLTHARLGPAIVSQLCVRIAAAAHPAWPPAVPSILLVPNRPRSSLIGTMLADALGRAAPGLQVPLVIACRKRKDRRQPRQNRPWTLSPNGHALLAGKWVLVVDTAAGHGKTIDNLARLAAAAGAATVAAAVLISRLTETCEQAFDARLSGGFHRLYCLPMRPVVIRGRDASLCPVCGRKAAIKQFGATSGIPELEQWSASLVRPRRRTRAAEPERKHDDVVQRRLFPEPDEFFENCGSAVASGVTLHALNAAMTDGMAALTLPELFNNRIPSRYRAAMVANLPSGAVEWSGEALEQDLREFLRKGTATNVWRASAEVVAREGAGEWAQHIDGLLDRVGGKTKLAPGFWAHLAYTACITASRDPGAKVAVRSRIEALLEAKASTPQAEGLQLILRTLNR